jgi:hypothetical protein
VKIIFVFRNPLDQVVSMARHLKNHINTEADKWSDITKKEVKMHLIRAYLKMYLSYYYMENRFRKQIKFISYEQLFTNTETVLKDILQFFDFDLNKDNRENLFKKALSFVSMESLRTLELKTGNTLAKDQKVSAKHESHMRGGQIGKWQNYFTQNDLMEIEKLFNSFKLSLNDFDGININF